MANIIVTSSQHGSFNDPGDCRTMKLYDELKHLIETEHIQKNLDIQNICSTINKMSNEHCTVIFILILHHYLTSGHINSSKKNLIEMLEKRTLSRVVTYRGKVMKSGKGIMYKINDLPIDLQMIIEKYIEIVSI